jgi:hypothetical protein
MPTPAGVINPKGAYGLPLAGTNIGGQVVMSNDTFCIELTNLSGVTLLYGDVVVFGTGSTPTYDASGLNAGITPTLNDVLVAGVVSQIGNPAAGVPTGNPMLVVVRGIARVNVVNTNPIIIGTALTAAGVVKQATGNVTAITVANAASTFAVAAEAFAAADTRSDGARTVRAKLCVGV